MLNLEQFFNLVMVTSSQMESLIVAFSACLNFDTSRASPACAWIDVKLWLKCSWNCFWFWLVSLIFCTKKKNFFSTNKGPFYIGMALAGNKPCSYLVLKMGKNSWKSILQKHLNWISYCNTCWNSCLTLAPPLSPLYRRNFVDATDSRLETHFGW